MGVAAVVVASTDRDLRIGDEGGAVVVGVASMVVASTDRDLSLGMRAEQW